MKIEVNKIPEEGYWLDTEEAIEGYELSYPLCEFVMPIAFHLFVSKVSHQLLVQGDFRTSVVMQCSRCLKDFLQKVAFKDFTFCEPLAGRLVIDLNPQVREDILIAIPVKPLCDLKCKGLCPRCGQDLNLKECGCKKGPSPISFNGLNTLRLD